MAYTDPADGRPSKARRRRPPLIADAETRPADRPGILTSEFWLAAVGLVVSGIMAVAEAGLSAEEWLDFAKWVVAGYALSRGVAKR